MLIGFLGAPMTGKTTAALGLSYELKMAGYACEYMPEPARVVIDHLGWNDQGLIAELERKNAQRANQFKDRIWVTDGGLYLGQFYGGPQFDTRDYDVVVFCENVFEANHDSGRKQTCCQARKIQEQIRAYADTLTNCVRYDQNNGVQHLKQQLGL